MLPTSSASTNRKSNRGMRAILRLSLAGTAALILPAYLSPKLNSWRSSLSSSASSAESSRSRHEEEMVEGEGMRRFLTAKEAESGVVYEELEMPEWLRDATFKNGEGGESSGIDQESLQSAMDEYAASTPLPSTSSGITPYTLEDAYEATTSFQNVVAIMVYDPESDDFLFLHDRRHHQWTNGYTKLVASFRDFTWMLRRTFPERFKGEESDELAIVISSGDYPHLRSGCLETFPHPNANCPAKHAPVLQFGSVFRHAEILPNMVAMPMPETHNLHCFKSWEWTRRRGRRLGTPSVCEALRPKEYGLKYDSLIPQVVWRGTDFGYLNHIERSLAQARPEWHLDREINKNGSNIDKEELGVSTMLAKYDGLWPRWKGVVLTAEAEHDIKQRGEEGDVAWANIKFTNGVFGDDAEKAMYAKWGEYGVPAIGERMNLPALAQHKYQIDLGGGGGTTWSGTIQKLAMPGLLFHHVTPTKDYIHDRMKPWVHYVPVAPDLTDLKEKYEWAEANPQAAKLIADQGSDLMRYIGTIEGYGEMYQDVFVEPVRRVIDAYQPISKTHPEASSWREVLELFSGSFNNVWRCSGKARRPGKAIRDSCVREGETMSSRQIERLRKRRGK